MKSGNDTEYRGTLSLIAGRIYPLRLEFSKATQGVKDKSKKKDKDKDKEKPAVKAFVGLWWKRPTGVDEPIPARQLSPTWAPDAFVCSTPFPPDDRSYGWERGTDDFEGMGRSGHRRRDRRGRVCRGASERPGWHVATTPPTVPQN